MTAILKSDKEQARAHHDKIAADQTVQDMQDAVDTQLRWNLLELCQKMGLNEAKTMTQTADILFKYVRNGPETA